jgi:hypothetical protein
MTTPSAGQNPAPLSFSDSPQSWLTPGERPKTIVDSLLSRPDATRLLRATPIQPLYLLIKSLGLADAHELIAMCLPEQIQGLIDLDVWDRDELKSGQLGAWLSHLVELPPQRCASHVRKLDPELVTTFLANQVRVYDLSEEDLVPDEPQGMFYETPDRFFVIDILPSQDGDSDRAVLIHRLLEHLYRGDLDLARAVVNAARWDSGAETEELAYRFRSGRIADLGFVEYYDALRIYQEVDPKAKPPAKTTAATHKHPAQHAAGDVKGTGPGGFLDAESGLWVQLVPQLGQPSSLLYRVTSGLDESERNDLLQELVYLGNQAMSADRVPMDDLAQTEQTLQRTAGYLLLGLAQLCGQKGAQAGSAHESAVAIDMLRSVPLAYLFRLGHSLTQHVRKLAKLLVDGGATTVDKTLSPTSLLPKPEADALLAILAPRPLYPVSLDDPQKSGARPFASLRDLGRAAQFVEQLALRQKLLTMGMGLRQELLQDTLSRTVPDASQATWDDVLGTMLANHLLQRPAALVPIMRRDLVPLRRMIGPQDEPKQAQLPELLRARCTKLIEERIADRQTDPESARLLLGPAQRAFVERVQSQLAQGLATLPDVLDDEAADVVPRVPGLLLG